MDTVKDSTPSPAAELAPTGVSLHAYEDPEAYEDLEIQEMELEERLNLCNKRALHLARSSGPENTKKAPTKTEGMASRLSILFILYKIYKALVLTLFCRSSVYARDFRMAPRLQKRS